MLSQLQDWTGQIERTEQCCFAFGGLVDIYKGRLPSGEQVAVKVLRMCGSDTRRRFLREVSVWSALSHPNILPLLGISHDLDISPTPCLVSPYYPRGDVMTYIRKGGTVDKNQIMTQVASALSYLHDASIIHGDLKGSNILINDEGSAVLADFGLSKILGTSGFTTKSSSVSSWLAGVGEDINPATTEGWRWKANELMAVGLNEEDSSPQLTVATDVWAFGMTVLEVFSGFIPFSHIKSDARVIVFVTSGGRPKHQRYPQISSDVWRMLEGCWDVEPNRRPSMATFYRFLESQATRAQL